MSRGYKQNVYILREHPLPGKALPWNAILCVQ